MPPTPHLCTRHCGIAAVLLLALVLASTDGLEAQAEMPTAGEVSEALETLRRLERALESARAPAPDAVGDDALSIPTVGSSASPQVVNTPSSFALNLAGDVSLGGFVFKENLPFLHNDGGATFRNTALGINALIQSAPTASEGSHNSALGYRAMYANTTGRRNTATGAFALVKNTDGSVNTASGYLSLYYNDSGSRNTAVGSRALLANTSGSRNTAVGYDALFLNTEGMGNTAVGAHAMESIDEDNIFDHGFNVAVGYRAMADSLDGSNNAAVGAYALEGNSGGRNTAIGRSAGANWTSAAFSIALGSGSDGDAGDSGVIRIGGNDHQSKTFIEGIRGASIASMTTVMINGSNQLGTVTSSARFKQEIRQVDSVTERLLALRPVSFRYKEELVDLPDGEANPLEYGLLAEEVAKVFPELVINDEEGRPYTVRYRLLTPLLLAEVQELRDQAEARDRVLTDLRQIVVKQDRRLEDLTRMVCEE